MAIQPLANLADLSIAELYRVYLAIARSDHKWRVQAVYGNGDPPAGHCELRPIAYEQFEERFAKAQSLVQGEQLFRQRLARQAAAYRVDVTAELASIRKAA